MNCALYALSYNNPTVKKLLNQLAVTFLASIIIWLAHRRWQKLREQTKGERYDNGLQKSDLIVIQRDGQTMRGLVTRKKQGITFVATHRSGKWTNYGLLDSDFTILVLTRARQGGIDANGLR